jgi:hypothetical protein
MKKSILFLFLAVVLVSTLVVSYANAAGPLEISKYDVTQTSVGAQIAQESMQRWQSYGWNFNSKGLKVYELNPGDYLVAPESTKIVLKSILQSDGSAKLDAGVVTAFSPSVSSTEAQGVIPMQTPYWSLVASQCFTRVENSTGWIDHCYQMNKLVGDTDPQKDYYQLQHYATAESKSIWILKDAELACQRNGGSTQEWVDWSPRSDLPASQCGTIGISVSAFGIGISASHTICPTMWDISKYAEAGKFANMWTGSAWRSEREVAYMICVKVPQGGWPVWLLTPGFHCTL